jgi:hypothetical protein
LAVVGPPPRRHTYSAPSCNGHRVQLGFRISSRGSSDTEILLENTAVFFEKSEHHVAGKAQESPNRSGLVIMICV